MIASSRSYALPAYLSTRPPPPFARFSKYRTRNTFHSNVYIYIIMSSIAAALGAIESLDPNEKINIAKIAREYDCDRSTLSKHYKDV